jgi:hypothetical protein
MGALPNAPVKVGDHTLVVNPIVEFGYLTVTTDARTLTVTFKTATKQQTTSDAARFGHGGSEERQDYFRSKRSSA